MNQNPEDSTYWDCLRVRDKECRARAVTSTNHLGELIVIKGPAQSAHRHAPNPDEVEAETGILELRMGRKIKAVPKKKWLDTQKNLQKTVQGYAGYGADGILDYLRTVSHHIAFD